MELLNLNTVILDTKEHEIGEQLSAALVHEQLLLDAKASKEKALAIIAYSDISEDRKDYLRKLVSTYLADMLNDGTTLLERGCEDDELKTYIEQLKGTV